MKGIKDAFYALLTQMGGLIDMSLIETLKTSD